MIPFSRNLDICSLTFLLSWAEKLIVVGMVDCIGVKRKSILYSLTAFKMLGSCGNGFHFPSKCWIWLISWSTLWFSLARPNLLVGCPVHVTLGGLAASGTGAFVVVPGWTFPDKVCFAAQMKLVSYSVFSNSPSMLFSMERWKSPLKGTELPHKSLPDVDWRGKNSIENQPCY